MANRITGYRYTWWRGDRLPPLPPLAHFHAERTHDAQMLARLHQLDIPTIDARIQAGNHPYVAFLQSIPVAYGWVATRIERIEPDLAWPLAAHECSLWDFATLPAWRGRGIYPRLLQAILQAEAVAAERFWIGHTAGNTASQRGILKAGFHLTIRSVMTASGQITWVYHGRRARALADPMVQHLGISEVMRPDGTDPSA